MRGGGPEISRFAALGSRQPARLGSVRWSLSWDRLSGDPAPLAQLGPACLPAVVWLV